MSATLYIIGVGPGDPDLLTLKGARILENCPVIVSPKGSLKGSSTALTIVKGAVDLDDKESYELLFPMKKIPINSEVDKTVREAWLDAANLIIKSINQGKDVAFPTLGDPAIYSTGYYLFETIREIAPDIPIKFIPGIPAMSSCSAATSTPICLGDEMLAVIPATFADERIRQTLNMFDTIVLMKVHRVYDKIVGLLKELELLDRSILVEKAGTKNERVIENLEETTEAVHYFSTIIIRKNGCRPSQASYLHAVAVADMGSNCELTTA